MLSEENPRRLAQVALVTLLIIGCIAVVLPFVGAVLFAVVLWLCTWPAYSRYVLPRLGGRRGLGASLMTLLLVLILFLPMGFLAVSIAGGVDDLIDTTRPLVASGFPPYPPDFLRKLPFFGSEIERAWHRVAVSKTELSAVMRQMQDPAQRFLLATGKMAGNGLLQLALVLFVGFFLYRDGEAFGRALRTASRKLGGELGEEMLELTRQTVIGVMLGIVGTAVAQALVATLGFVLAGVPGAALLGFATFFLSMVPMGPPLIWGGAAVWLYGQGDTGWAIFLVVYGVLVISSIDNVLKPILMARGAGLSILLIGLGVLGGLLVFGFIGIFLGPVLLALGQMLFIRWSARTDEGGAEKRCKDD